MSFSKNVRRSSTPCFSMAMRAGTHSERPAGVAFRIVPDVRDHGRIYHAGTHDLEPVGFLAGTIWTRDDALHVDLSARLGEREEGRTEPDLGIWTPVAPGEFGQRALEVHERDTLVDDEALDLHEGRRVRRIVRIAAIDPARREDTDGRLVRLHRPHLHR